MNKGSNSSDASTSVSSEGSVEDRAGVAEMTTDGKLTITMFNTEGGRDTTDTLLPSDRDYEPTRIIAGGILQGQRKNIPRYVASADMQADGTIIYAPLGPGADPVVAQQKIKQGTARYREIMSIVPDLTPGTFRMISEAMIRSSTSVSSISSSK